MITGYDRELAMEKYNEIQPLEFLIKPITPSILFNSITRALHLNAKWPQGDQENQLNSTLIDLYKCRILVVEDQAINQQIVSEILSDAGAVVTIAENGYQALDLLDQQDFDLVFMDIQMPEMDGYQTTQKIRAKPDLAELPIIAMTAHAMKQDREKCLSAGMNDHIAKPVVAEEMLRVTQHWLPKSILPDTSPITSETTSYDTPSTTIDFNKALKYLGGKRELLFRLLKSFASNYSNSTVLFQQHININDMAAGRELAHAIKGVSENIGLKTLSDIAAKLEKCFTETQINSELLDQYDIALSQALEEIALLDEP